MTLRPGHIEDAELSTVVPDPGAIALSDAVERRQVCLSEWDLPVGSAVRDGRTDV